MELSAYAFVITAVEISSRKRSAFFVGVCLITEIEQYETMATLKTIIIMISNEYYKIKINCRVIDFYFPGCSYF